MIHQVIMFKNVECTESNHYQSNDMLGYDGNYTDKVVYSLFDNSLRVINWIYPSEFKQYNGTN